MIEEYSNDEEEKSQKKSAKSRASKNKKIKLKNNNTSKSFPKRGMFDLYAIKDEVKRNLKFNLWRIAEGIKRFKYIPVEKNGLVEFHQTLEVSQIFFN